MELGYHPRYKTVTCGACGAEVTIDLDNGWPDPYAHEDDCPNAEMPDPSGTLDTRSSR